MRLVRTPFVWVFAAVLGVWVAAYGSLPYPYAQDHPGDGTYKPSRQRGEGHYTYLATLSLGLDLDLELEDELAAFGDPDHGHRGSIGGALFQVPFLWIAQAAAWGANRFGAGIALHGYTPFHASIIGLGNLLAALAGLWLAYRLARRHASETAALYGVALVGLGTGVYLYASRFSSYDRAWSILWAAWLVEHWDRTRGRHDVRRYAALGALVGALMLVRPADGFLAVVPAAEGALELARRLRRRQWPAALALVGNGIVAAAWATVILLPSLLVQRRDTGAWLPSVRFDSPFWSESLWSSRGGLFVWTPIAGFALLGLLLGPWRRARATVLGLLACFAAEVYAGGATWWDDGEGRLVALTVLLVAGIAFLVERLHAVRVRWPRLAPHAALLLMAAPLVAMNLEMAQQVSLGSRTRVAHNTPQPTSTLYAGSLARMTTWVFDRLGTPTAFPANLLWALRTGAHPSRYDRIAGSERLEILAGSADLLLGGWEPPRQEGTSQVRTTGEQATLLAPLHVEDVSLTFRVMPATSDRLVVTLNGWEAPPSPLPPGPSDTVVHPPPGVVRAGTNVITLGPGVAFERLVIVPQP